MKSPLGKLRKFALYKSDSKDKRDLQSSAQLDELAQASKDMQDMRNCYDSLLSAAAATANSAYEFSESLREMGACLMEKTALNDDEESGRALQMLGKVQLDLQKLVDSYRAHIFLTITNPSESLLNELRTVEEMKRQCDEKRSVYDYMVAHQKEKGKPKSGKGETFSLQQLRAAQEEYDEEATLCVFRLKSLKQGQSRSLFTQAARHHAAQLNFFRKGLKSLEAVEPHVKLVSNQQHIEYQFSGLEDNIGDDGGDYGETENYANAEGELSFDYRPNKHTLDALTSRNSMEMDEDGVSSPRVSKLDDTEMISDKSHIDIKLPSREARISHSAPIFAEKKFDPAEKARQLLPLPTRKSHTYVLPTPSDAKTILSSRNSTSVLPRRTQNLWHSSPLDAKDERAPSLTPPLLSETLAHPQLDMINTSESKKVKRQAFSGPLIKPPSQIPQPSSSPKLSPSASPPLASSPRISELHELPRPPGSSFSANKASRSGGLVGHSAPLTLRVQELNPPNRISMPSPLPTPPPMSVPRSFSIPSRSQREMAIHVAKRFEPSQILNRAEDVASPPLTPISLSNISTISIVPEGPIHGGS